MSDPRSPANRPRKERKENADKRRTQIIDATMRSIIQNGLSRTTLATVANEAGLSQGVAVFYFKSKGGLLIETMREQYRRYEAHWTGYLAKADPDPLAQLVAIIEADFAPEICNPDQLALWFAFWGEQSFTPQYAEISGEFDRNRSEAIRQLCRTLFADQPDSNPDRIGDWIDTLTDGFWQKLHLFPGTLTPEHAVASTLDLVAELLPQHARHLRR